MHPDARAVDDDVIPPCLHFGKRGKTAELFEHFFKALLAPLVGKDVRARLRELFDAAPARTARAEDEHILSLHLNARVLEHEQKAHAVGVIARAGGTHHGIDGTERPRIPLQLLEVGHDVRLEWDGDVEGVVPFKQCLRPFPELFGRDADAVVGAGLAHFTQDKGVHRGAQRLGHVLADDSQL